VLEVACLELDACLHRRADIDGDKRCTCIHQRLHIAVVEPELTFKLPLGVSRDNDLATKRLHHCAFSIDCANR